MKKRIRRCTSTRRRKSQNKKMVPPKLNFLRRWLSREKKVKCAWCFCIVVFLVVFIDSFGVVRLYYERDFDSEFKFPVDTDDFPDLVRKYRNGDSIDRQPINHKYSTPKFLRTADSGCSGQHDLLILVKSAPAYFDNRAAIRATWGDPTYLQSISNTLLAPHQTYSWPGNKPPSIVSSPSSNVTSYNDNTFNHNNNNLGLTPNEIPTSQSESSTTARPRIKLIFLLGITNRMSKASQKTLSDEISKYDDIVQVDYIDSYENNTIKAMVALRWAIEVCPKFRFASLIDDDMYISVKNLVRFIDDPEGYPNPRKQKSETAELKSQQSDASPKNNELNKMQAEEADENIQLYGGRVLVVRPKRYKSSKWYLPLEEYPYNYFPPYVPAASVVMSRSTLSDFYYASFFTSHFRFDDVFLGILAYKMNIRPINSNYFHVCHDVGGKCSSDDDESVNHTLQTVKETSSSYDNVIAMHGLSSAEELLDYWNLQKDIGNI